MIVALITCQVDIQLGVSCLILVSQHYHQVIHNRVQHGSSRRLNPTGVRQFGRTRSRNPHPHRQCYSTQPKISSHQGQRTTCIACTANKASIPEDPHSILRACRPKCRLQKIHHGTRGTHLHMHASNGKPELGGDMDEMRIESKLRGRPYTLPTCG